MGGMWVLGRFVPVGKGGTLTDKGMGRDKKTHIPDILARIPPPWKEQNYRGWGWIHGQTPMGTFASPYP